MTLQWPATVFLFQRHRVKNGAGSWQANVTLDDVTPCPPSSAKLGRSSVIAARSTQAGQPDPLSAEDIISSLQVTSVAWETAQMKGGQDLKFFVHPAGMWRVDCRSLGLVIIMIFYNFCILLILKRTFYFTLKVEGFFSFIRIVKSLVFKRFWVRF